MSVRSSKTMLDAIKGAGASTALFEALGSRLWAARMACEEARKDRAKNFKKELKRVRIALDEAEAIHAEWVKHGRC